VVLHLDAPIIIPLSDMMKKLPLPFVIDHMGRVPSADGVDQPPLRALIELSRLENCWIKVCGAERISMPPYAAAVPIARALVEASPNRVLSVSYTHLDVYKRQVLEVRQLSVRSAAQLISVTVSVGVAHRRPGDRCV